MLRKHANEASIKLLCLILSFSTTANGLFSAGEGFELAAEIASEVVPAFKLRRLVVQRKCLVETAEKELFQGQAAE